MQRTPAKADIDEKTAKPNRPKALIQPVEVANHPGALLRLPTVCAMVGLQRSAVYQRIREGRFPPQQKLGPRASRWKAADINEWLRNPR